MAVPEKTLVQCTNLPEMQGSHSWMVKTSCFIVDFYTLKWTITESGNQIKDEEKSLDSFDGLQLVTASVH